MKIGVLALQGAFAKHQEALLKLEIETVQVRKSEELLACDGLIIPGGESTTIMRQLQFGNLKEPLKAFAKEKPIFGTCAGLILMSNKIIDDPMTPFGLLDVAVERNAFGSQTESFKTEIEFHAGGKKEKKVPAIFIRAPRIRDIGEAVEVLASFENEPILVKQGFHLGSTFHPELTGDLSIHDYFCKMVTKI